MGSKGFGFGPSIWAWKNWLREWKLPSGQETIPFDRAGNLDVLSKNSTWWVNKNGGVRNLESLFFLVLDIDDMLLQLEAFVFLTLDPFCFETTMTLGMKDEKPGPN